MSVKNKPAPNEIYAKFVKRVARADTILHNENSSQSEENWLPSDWWVSLYKKVIKAILSHSMVIY